MKFLLSVTTIVTAAFFFTSFANAQSYVRYSQDGGAVSWGELEGDTIHQLSDAPYLDGSRTGTMLDRSSVKLEAPVDPSQIFMTALNFRSHLPGEPASYPGLFTVPVSSIVGPEDPIIRPAESTNLHYEAEMVIVIGKHAENVSVEDAHEYVFGVTGGNDVTDRDWQGADLQWARAKGSRGFNAIGPVVVKGADYNNIDITGRLNGEERQGENSSDMLFSVDKMVSYVSTYFVLEPGDLIWSGTMGKTSAMEPGDVYEVELSGIGILSNVVEQEE
jgi:2-keto-4-pentenoate hydratase/2-oxohepta-3-ene-1,7-dioic acid hydratase in catechol pathway